MSDREFENYLALLAGLLKFGKGQRDGIAKELRGHLEERLEELVSEGLSREEAVRRALSEFGDAAGLAASFGDNSRGKRRRWMMRAMTFSAAASLLLAAGVVTFWPGRNAGPGVASVVAQVAAQPAEPSSAPQVLPAREAPRDRVAEALNRRIDIDFEETPLNDIAEYLTTLTDVTFHLQQKQLEEASVPIDAIVTSRFKNIRLRTWLDLALKNLELAYVVRDDVILITTPESAEAELEVRVYDCRDLLAMSAPVGADKWVPTWGSMGRGMGGMGGGMFSAADEKPAAGGTTGTAPPAQAKAKTVGGMGGMSAGGFGGGNESVERPMSEHALRVEALIELITGNIDSQSWDDVGGPGSVHEYNGLIVVTQTGQTHDKVERVLDMLRTAAGLSGPGKVVR